MIDIIEIYKKYNIKFWTEGKNVQPGWINIRCPFCDDVSNHLGFCIEKQYYYCWKCKFKFNDQVFSRLGIPLFELKNHVYVNLKILENLKQPIKKIPFILPGKPGLNKDAKRYLKNRNYDPQELIEKYKLRYCDHLSLDYNFRIIIPVIFQNKIVSYTTRDYTNKQSKRYISCPKNMEIIDHKKLLYNYDNCKKNYVFVFEGNFDTWRMGNDGLSTFGTTWTNAQINLLLKFEIIIIVFDKEETAQKEAQRLGEILSNFGKIIYTITPPKKDFSLLTPIEAKIFKKTILKKIGIYY